mgnify:CR=1 FL=1
MHGGGTADAQMHDLEALAFELGVVAFQMSAETHARVANAVEAAAKARGWSVTVLNSSGTMPTHLEQLETLVQKGVGAIVVAMGKPIEADAQLAGGRTLDFFRKHLA